MHPARRLTHAPHSAALLALAVRVAYPCFGNPTKAANGRVVSYPAYGRWRVHNLYVDVWQRAPQSGVLQPYNVIQAYRF